MSDYEMSEATTYDERVVQYVEPKEEPTPRLLRQMVVQNHGDAVSGHRRHRQALNELTVRIATLEGQNNAAAAHMATVDELLKRPVEATAIRYDLRTVLVLLSICAAVVGGQKWATGGFQEQLTKQASHIDVIDAKMDAIKQHDVDVQKLQDNRAQQVQMDLLRIANQASAIDAKLNNLMIGKR